MTTSHWLGGIVLFGLVVFILFAFRQGFQVKPDRNRKVEDWIDITLFGKGRQPTIEIFQGQSESEYKDNVLLCTLAYRATRRQDRTRTIGAGNR